jgi:uncharacterized membrane protein YdbT with pleckstrin-like domain
MKTKSFKPNPRYLTKLRTAITIVAALIFAGGVLTALLIGLDSDVDASDVTLIIVISVAADVLWWLPALLLTGPYYRSLSYEVQDDEVIVHVGIWTKSVKHVPYRTVTNLTVNRDILDRWLFGLGALNIQTAGMSGTTGAEEALVGLPNVQEVYEIVATELRRFRGSMAPTAAEVEGEPIAPSTETLNAILSEIQAIHQTLRERP